MIKEIKFTDKALKQIENLLSKKDEGAFFRIAIKGGGCSGFQYEFTFDKSKQDDDLNHELDLKFLLDPHLGLNILRSILLFEQLQLNE